jgi:oligoribonuclease NrnB/cAMP/cGMP phosphodiesterase (DHH superfamily)
MGKGRRTESSLASALQSRKEQVVHLTHNDLDAVGADAIHRMVYGGVFTIYCSVGSFAQNLATVSSQPGKGNLLSITDLGYQQGIEKHVEAAAKRGWRIEWRDHHRWQESEIQTVGALVALLRIDTETCACGLVARDIAPDNPTAVEVGRVVCDYDLWKNQDPRAAVLGRVLSREENRSYVRDCLVKGVFSDARIESEYQTIDKEMREAIEKSLRRARTAGTKYRIVFTPLYGYPSETAYALREKVHPDIEIGVSPAGLFWIRSVPPISHRIARRFDGGGHPHAAGGNFRFTLFDKIRFWLFASSRHYADLVTTAESL